MARKHANPHYADRTGVAPYNFVPLPERVLAVEDPAPQDEYRGHSGWFECELETSSPTYIRGMVSATDYQNGKQAKDQPGFFSADGGKTPLIPGSSLRGLFRTLVEVVSYSKMSAVTDQRLVYRAVDTTSHGVNYRWRMMQETSKNHFVPRARAGYVRHTGGEWYIQPAQEFNGTTFARLAIRDIPPDLSPWKLDGEDPDAPVIKNANEIYILAGPYTYQDVRGGFLKIKYSKVQRVSAKPGTGLQKAVLARSGPMTTKRSEAVTFPPDPRKSKPDDWITIPPGLVRIYRDQISDEQRELLGDQGVLREGQPVFYLMERDVEEDERGRKKEIERLVFFGHTMMMRLPYTRSPRDLLKGLWPEDELDLAEALFGFVPASADDKRSAVAGRVFFSDARWVAHPATPFEREITPQVLSSPKPTTFQHYLEQPEPDDRLRLRNYDDKTRLRGHKFYWHKGEVKPRQFEETDPKKLRHASQYTRIQPLRAGERFTFTLRFDNLTDKELGALAWVLQLAADPAYRLKLGMGKPLGMGAVKVTARLKLIDRTARYRRLWDTGQANWLLGEMPGTETEQIRKNAIQQFEQWVLDDDAVNPNHHAQRLTEVKRITHLLELLAWPGPDPSLTRYMEIEHPDPKAKRGKRNEYRERPVLPDVLAVGAPVKAEKAPPPKPLNEAAEYEPEVQARSTSAQLSQPQASPMLPKEAEPSQFAKDMEALLKTRAEEREAEEEQKRKKRLERKGKRK